MTTPARRGPGRPKGSTNKPKTAESDSASRVAVPEASEVRTAVEPVSPVCDCADKLKELEKRLRFLEIRIL